MPTPVECYRRAGRILSQALQVGAGMVKEGVLYLEVATAVEALIREQATPAFPVNISVNEVAAHYTPTLQDSLVFKRGDLVKLDAGVHVDGYIADAALTVEVDGNTHATLMEASREALHRAMAMVCSGVRVSAIGKAIEEAITSYALKPVINLNGHSLERYNLHAGLSIPNVETTSRRTLRAGEVIAIEPFVTDGQGSVVNGEHGHIYHLTGRGRGSIVQSLQRSFDGLPFASRWMADLVGPDRVQTTLRFLLRRRMVHAYSMLVEAGGGRVAQTEHTVLVTDDGCEVLTDPQW